MFHTELLANRAVNYLNITQIFFFKKTMNNKKHRVVILYNKITNLNPNLNLLLLRFLNIMP